MMRVAEETYVSAKKKLKHAGTMLATHGNMGGRDNDIPR